MKTTLVVRAADNATICARCQIADNLWTRMRGLSGRASLGDDEGLLIIPCPSIHMFGMKFSLDVVFLTKDFIVTDIRENIAPRQIYVAKNHAGKAHSALEMAAGSVARCGVKIGEKLQVRES